MARDVTEQDVGSGVLLGRPNRQGDRLQSHTGATPAEQAKSNYRNLS